MATPKWDPAKLYPPGSLVTPRTVVPAADAVIENPGFETGDLTGWTAQAGLIVSHNGVYQGAWALELALGQSGFRLCLSNSRKPVRPGQSITAQAMIHQGASSVGNTGGLCYLYWYDEDDNEISHSDGNNVNNGSGGAIIPSRVTATAPANAAYVRVAVGLYRNGQNFVTNADNVSWNYTYQGPPSGLVYRAVQPAAGYSSNVEPEWPGVLGVQVIDNEVIWEAVLANRVVYQARPILRSGLTEPNWPEVVGAFVSDNTISWETVSFRVDDDRCPNSPIVTIMAGHIFAADKDIVPFCAAGNAKDWHTPRDAGYLPVGLQVLGSNDTAALGPYRSNLIPFNSEAFQMWQVDENPQNNSILDALPVGSTYHKALAPVSNDLFFLTALGVRTIGISAGSTNLAAGDVGLPIDPLVQDALKRAAEAGVEPFAFYWPGSGQYWLIFNLPGVFSFYNQIGDGAPFTRNFEYQTEVFVYTISQLQQVGAWSRYLFPFAIDDVIMDGSTVVFRAGDNVVELDPEMVEDLCVPGDSEEWEGIPFPGRVWWPWLDMGSPGRDKNMEGFDYVGEAEAILEIGFNQTDKTDDAFTRPYRIMEDTVPGDIYSYEVTAPSISVRLTFPGGERWRVLAMNLYLIGRT